MAAIQHPLGGQRRGVPVPGGLGAINWWLIGALLVASAAAMLPVVQNSSATSEGFDLQAYQRQEAALKANISLLEADVARLTSLKRIERRAREIGLVDATDPIFVHVNEPGPAPAKLPSEYLPRLEPQRGEPDSWWKPLVGWLPFGS
jgi:hypothetical protein